MLFLVALQNFVVLHTKSGNRVTFASDTAADGFNYVSFYDDDDTSNEMVFSCSAEIAIDPNDPASFTVKDTDGDAIQFTAYTPATLRTTPSEPKQGIHKATITLAVLFDSSNDSVDDVLSMSPATLLEESDTGHMMARELSRTVEFIPNERVIAEEQAMGGDGTFFADPDELAHARMDAEGEDA